MIPRKRTLPRAMHSRRRRKETLSKEAAPKEAIREGRARKMCPRRTHLREIREETLPEEGMPMEATSNEATQRSRVQAGHT